eukprot:gene33753-40842_t
MCESKKQFLKQPLKAMKTTVKVEEDEQVVDVASLVKRRDELKGKLQNLDENVAAAGPAPKKPECQWDYVLKEVCWLADDFQKERVRLANNAKKLVKATEAFAKTADQRREKKTKEELVLLKKVSTKVSREVRKYWLKINQLITLRQKQESEEIRQQAMEKHLQYLVRQTERYANVVAQQLATGGLEDDSQSEDNDDANDTEIHPSKRLKAHEDSEGDRGDARSDEEDDDVSFMLSDEEEDNESTLLEQEEAERREREERRALRELRKRKHAAAEGEDEDFAVGDEGVEDDVDSEIACLQDEANMSVEELARKYGYASTSHGFALPGVGEEEAEGDASDKAASDLDDDDVAAVDDQRDDDESFVASDEDEDNESTLLEQEEAERREREQRVRDGEDGAGDDHSEVACLQDEANMSVEELARKYGYQAGATGFTLPDDYEDEDEGEEEEEVEGLDVEEESFDQHERTNDGDQPDDDESFVASDEDEDNESTLLEQEEAERREKEERRLARRQRRRGARGNDEDDEQPDSDGQQDEDDADSELAMLRDEANMSVEELARKYGYRASSSGAGFDLPEDEENEEDGEDATASAKHGADVSSEGAEASPIPPVASSAAPPAEEDLDSDVVDMDVGADQEGDDDASYTLSEEEEDNESTLLEQEEIERREREERKLARKLRSKQARMHEQDEGDEEDEDSEADADSEVAMLQDEAEMSIEELAKKYGYSAGANGFTLMDAEEASEEKVGTTDQEYMSTDSILRSSAKRRFAALENAREKESVVTVATKSSKAASYSSRLAAFEAATRTTKMPLPFILRNINLREYQHVGMSWLISLHDRRLNGILADEMGLGKTIQTIAALAYLALYKGIWGPHLIIVPTSCIVNWECELKKFCPAFKILTYFGTAKQRKNLRVGWSKLNTFHICITSYQIILSDNRIFRRK